MSKTLIPNDTMGLPERSGPWQGRHPGGCGRWGGRPNIMGEVRPKDTDQEKTYNEVMFLFPHPFCLHPPLPLFSCLGSESQRQKLRLRISRVRAAIKINLKLWLIGNNKAIPCSAQTQLKHSGIKERTQTASLCTAKQELMEVLISFLLSETHFITETS